MPPREGMDRRGQSGQVDSSTWKMRLSRSAGPSTEDGFRPGKGQLGRGAWAPAAFLQPSGFLGHRCLSETFQEGLCMSPAQVAGGPESGRATLEQRDREPSGQGPLVPLPQPHHHQAVSALHCLSPRPQQDPEKQVLLPPPPTPTTLPPKTFKCIRHTECIKHDGFLRHELAGLPWLPLP